jgi:hypothetical protein
VTRTVALTVTLLLPATLAAGQDASLQPRTANTLAAPSTFASPSATLRDMAWLAGEWTGAGLGGVTDEVWSPAASGAMMGMFRLVKDGKVVFYEFLTLVEEGGSLVLKLKHFNADLTGWEEKADFVSFRLLKVAPDVAHFAGLTFKRVGDDRAEIFLAIRDRTTGVVREERFAMTRRR